MHQSSPLTVYTNYILPLTDAQVVGCSMALSLDHYLLGYTD